MAKNEAPVSTKSANHKKGWRPLALFTVFALSACTAGRVTDKSTDAQRQLFPSNSATPAPQKEGPRAIPILVDCVRNPKAVGGVAAPENPKKFGATYVLGTYDSAAPLMPDGQKAVIDGVTVVHEGPRRYSVMPANYPNANPLEVLDFNGGGSDYVGNFAIHGANVTVESVTMPDDASHVALVATIVCTGAARS